VDFLNNIDYSIIIAYFCVLVIISLCLRKMATKNMDSFFLGGRNLPWWMLGISGMASQFDMTGTMLIASFLYMLGTRGFYIEGFRGGGGLFLVVVLIWTGKYHRRSGCMTGAEWMAFRFGEGKGGQFARLAMAMAKIAWAVGMTAYLVKGVGMFLSMFLPFQPWQCALGLMTLGSLYIMIAGFYGVVFADIFQSSIILTAVIAITTTAIIKVSGTTDFATIATSTTDNLQWMSSKLSMHAKMPDGYKQYELMGVIASFYLLRAVFNGMGMGDDPKYFGAKNDRECGTLSFMWVCLMMFRWPLMMSFTVLGIFLVRDFFPDQATIAAAATVIKANVASIDKSQWVELTTRIIRTPESFPEIVQGLKDVLGDAWARKLTLVSFEGTVNPERVVPSVILNIIPIGFRGLFITALIAASVSTFGFMVNMVTAFFTKDIYQRYMRKDAGNAELIFASRVFTVGMVAIGFYFGTQAKNINEIWAWVTMALTGGLTAPLFLRFYWWRFNGGGFAVGTIAGMIGAVTLKLGQPALSEISYLTWLTDEKWFFVTLFSIGLFGSIIGTYMTQPTDKKIVEHFYKTTLPIGFWGPLKKRLPKVIRAKAEKEHRNDIIALPFTMTWMITLFIMPTQVVTGAWGPLRISGGLFVISLIGMYFFWYRNLPKKNFYEKDEVHLVEETS